MWRCWGAIPRIGLAIVIAILQFPWDGWRPHSAVLGRADGLKGYRDITRYPAVRQIPGLVLIPPGWAPVFRQMPSCSRAVCWRRWRARPLRPAGAWSRPSRSPASTSPRLAELEEALRKAGTELRFAELKDPVKEKFKRLGLFARFGRGRLLPHEKRRRGRPLGRPPVECVDWEDRVRVA